MNMHLFLQHVPVLTIPDSFRTNFKSDGNSVVTDKNLSRMIAAARDMSENSRGKKTAASPFLAVEGSVDMIGAQVRAAGCSQTHLPSFDVTDGLVVDVFGHSAGALDLGHVLKAKAASTAIRANSAGRHDIIDVSVRDGPSRPRPISAMRCDIANN
ncbi:hypothetical protein NUU61_004530 [Penicillium alfredii]|uniref:Uncharacterized protein n=1 Tax=Penicillium alfredii TaxID=1506179 RepID=A0A9W9FLB3_9EURO|nr:uncharacterized protein NUU61_004530 [Penicillium alfredii]KAJ5102308.1 hypothetical protein NUU61_004530 [Penicillium alfredii]